MSFRADALSGMPVRIPFIRSITNVVTPTSFPSVIFANTNSTNLPQRLTNHDLKIKTGRRIPLKELNGLKIKIVVRHYNFKVKKNCG